MSHPSRDEYIRRAIKLAQSEARVRRNKKYSDHAREAARAWVGMIELRAMGSIKGYVSAFSKPYQPPHTAVIPAAPKISLSKMGLRVTYLPAGSPFRFYEDHVAEVTNLFDGLTISRVPGEQYTRETRFPEDLVHISWHTDCTVTFNMFLLSPNGKEHTTSRTTTRIVAAFPTKAAATRWVKARAAELQESHDRNHARQCRDEVCAKRGHTYIPRYDED